MRMRAKFALVSGVIALMLIGVSAVHAERSRKNVFSKLNSIQGERDEAARSAAEHEVGLTSLDDEIADRRRRADVARRAAGPVHRRMASTLGNWQRVMRRLERGPATVERADARQLLLAASRDAIEPSLEDVEVLTRAEGEHHAFLREVDRRVRLTVKFAQDRAKSETREAEQEQVVQQARRDPEVREDLQATDESLHRSLSHMLKNDTARDFHRLKGTLIPPVAGSPVAVFGPRAQGKTKVSTRHTGYTWKISAGTPLKAAAAGLIVYAHRFEGYGNLVIIDHGGGYHTLYAHLKSIGVEMGQTVPRGHLIGMTGETGSLEGPKLYFELRHDGTAIDPAAWFVRHD